jgi:hypothetical protein
LIFEAHGQPEKLDQGGLSNAIQIWPLLGSLFHAAIVSFGHQNSIVGRDCI